MTHLTESPSVDFLSFQNWMSFLKARNSKTLRRVEEKEEEEDVEEDVEEDEEVEEDDDEEHDGEDEEDVPVDDGDDEGADQQVDVRLQERLLDGVLREQIIEINTNIKKINKGNKINSNLKKKSFRRPPGPGPRPPRPSGYPAC